MSEVTYADWLNAMVEQRNAAPEQHSAQSYHYNISNNTASNTTPGGSFDIISTSSTTNTSGHWQQGSQYGKYWDKIYPGTNPNPGTNPLPDSPIHPSPPVVKEVEVLVMECPKCEEIKRVEDDFLKGDYICKKCRGVG
jgi:hypothetical protein